MFTDRENRVIINESTSNEGDRRVRPTVSAQAQHVQRVDMSRRKQRRLQQQQT